MEFGTEFLGMYVDFSEFVYMDIIRSLNENNFFVKVRDAGFQLSNLNLWRFVHTLNYMKYFAA